jgi:hypothetical protein
MIGPGDRMACDDDAMEEEDVGTNARRFPRNECPRPELHIIHPLCTCQVKVPGLAAGRASLGPASVSWPYPLSYRVNPCDPHERSGRTRAWRVTRTETSCLRRARVVVWYLVTPRASTSWVSSRVSRAPEDRHVWR